MVYQRAWNGTLTLAGTYATGGMGGVAAGSAVDPLASQGSLASAGRSPLAGPGGRRRVTGWVRPHETRTLNLTSP